VFVFEAPQVEWNVNDLVDDPLVAVALAQWAPLVEGRPRVAQEAYHWERVGHSDRLGLGF
jgi:hypothetical protein